MRSYELFLTNKCTRNCAFCDIPKNSFVSTENDATDFIEYVKQHESLLSNFHISFFGGEPLLCIDLIYKVIDAFKDYPNCYFFATTNADLIDSLDVSRLTSRFIISISAYDIFNDAQKYEAMNQKFHALKPAFLFTFDQSTINKVDEFVSICQKNNLEYKVAFSHSYKSWDKLPINELKSKLCSFYNGELQNFYDSKSFVPNQSIKRYVNRFMQCIFDKNTKEFFCITEDKTVFYNGQDIGPCIRLKGICNFQYPRRCKECKYAQCCSKGCVAEYHDENIDEKLCIINKVAFEAVENFISIHREENRMKQILSYFYRHI